MVSLFWCMMDVHNTNEIPLLFETAVSFRFQPHLGADGLLARLPFLGLSPADVNAF